MCHTLAVWHIFFNLPVMKLEYRNSKTAGECKLIYEESSFDRQFYGKDRKDKLLTIAWNKGESQTGPHRWN